MLQQHTQSFKFWATSGTFLKTRSSTKNQVTFTLSNIVQSYVVKNLIVMHI